MQIQAQVPRYQQPINLNFHQPEQSSQMEKQGASPREKFEWQHEKGYFQKQLEQLNQQKKEQPLQKDPDSSGPNAVGQLATQLANARNRLDVQSVISKATEKLSSLRMRAANAQGKERVRLQNQIARVEKLLKRTRLKLRNITKEEHLEQKRKVAEKQERFQEAQKLKSELQNKRKRRVKEESDYAIKERAKDSELACNDLQAQIMSISPENLFAGAAMAVDTSAAAVPEMAAPAQTLDVRV